LLDPEGVSPSETAGWPFSEGGGGRLSTPGENDASGFADTHYSTPGEGGSRAQRKNKRVPLNIAPHPKKLRKGGNKRGIYVRREGVLREVRNEETACYGTSEKEEEDKDCLLRRG